MVTRVRAGTGGEKSSWGATRTKCGFSAERRAGGKRSWSFKARALLCTRHEIKMMEGCLLLASVLWWFEQEPVSFASFSFFFQFVSLCCWGGTACEENSEFRILIDGRTGGDE